MNTLLQNILKGLFLGLLYFEITKANDTTFYNLTLYTFFFVIMVYAAQLTNTNENIVLNAFVTKTVFTILDERVKRKS